jgi:hypothetical protein
VQQGGDWHISLWVEASDDAHRVDAIAPSGELVGVDHDTRSGQFVGQIRVPESEVSGPSLFIPVLITDQAHNRLEIEVEVELDTSVR